MVNPKFEFRNPKTEFKKRRLCFFFGLVIGNSFVIGHSSFVIPLH
jgi:hypothetical protein